MVKVNVGIVALATVGLLLGAAAPSQTRPAASSSSAVPTILPTHTIEATVVPKALKEAIVPFTMDAISDQVVFAGVRIGDAVRLAASQNGGKTWALRGSLPADSSATWQFNFVNRRQGYAWGDEGLWFSDNGGGTWALVNHSALQAVAFSTPTMGTAVRAGTIVKTTDGGRHWHVVLSKPDETFEGVSMVTPELGYASAVSAKEPRLYQTTDGGKRWVDIAAGVHHGPWANAYQEYVKAMHLTEFTRPTRLTFDQGATVTFTSARDGWVELFDGGLVATVVFHTTNGGQSWSYALGNAGCAMGCNPIDGGRYPASYFGANTVWRYDGTRLDRSTNGGRTWTAGGVLPLSPMALDAGTTSGATVFLSNKVGWIATQAAIFKTTNGGQTWHAEWPSSPDQVATVAFFGRQQGWLSTDLALGYVWETSDGGRHWQELPKDFGDIVGLDRFSPQQGMVLTAIGTEWITQNSGKTWVAHPLPPTFENGTHEVSWIQFVNPRVGYLGTMTRLWKTTDGGAAWQAVQSLPGQNTQASFSSPTTGWLLSSVGPAGEQTLSVTTNGGKTWRLVGQVPQTMSDLSFDSAQNGWLVPKTTGHELLHTENGGKSWTRVDLAHFAVRAVTVEHGAVYVVTVDGRILESRDGGRVWTQRLA